MAVSKAGRGIAFLITFVAWLLLTSQTDKNAFQSLTVVDTRDNNENNTTLHQMPQNEMNISWIDAIPFGELKENAVLIFFHIPKTGGSTYIGSVGKLDFIESHFAPGRNAFKRMLPRLNYLCSNPPSADEPRKTGLFILHGLAPSFWELQEQLQHWRSNAKANGVKIFVFTSLREPISWYLSAFNYHYRRDGRDRLPATEEGLLRAAQHNPLCTYLIKGYQYTRQSVRNQYKPTSEDCNAILHGMYKNMDWVGTTDRMKESTELLRRLLGLPPDFEFTNKRILTGKNGTLTLKMLSPHTIEYHRNISALDYDLYQKALEWEYQL